jgi:hypothetical protein
VGRQDRVPAEEYGKRVPGGKNTQADKSVLFLRRQERKRGAGDGFAQSRTRQFPAENLRQDVMGIAHGRKGLKMRIRLFFHETGQFRQEKRVTRQGHNPHPGGG